MPHPANYQAIRKILAMPNDADRILLRGLSLKQSREALALIALLHSRTNNESPMAWVTREFREMVALPVQK